MILAFSVSTTVVSIAAGVQAIATAFLVVYTSRYVRKVEEQNRQVKCHFEAQQEAYKRRERDRAALAVRTIETELRLNLSLLGDKFDEKAVSPLQAIAYEAGFWALPGRDLPKGSLEAIMKAYSRIAAYNARYDRFVDSTIAPEANIRNAKGPNALQHEYTPTREAVAEALELAFPQKVPAA